MPADIIPLSTHRNARTADTERPAAFSVEVTPDNLIVPHCEQLLTPTEALEFAEMIRARALECFGGRNG